VQLEGGTGTPCFWVHGLDGGVLPMTRLARTLSSRPFYGIRARGVESRGRPARRVEDMARTYVREVRRIQARGPYVLGGMCAGGPIALEMAQQLLAAGEEIALVVVVDPRIALEPPTVYRPEPGVRRRLRWWLGRLHLLEIRLERETRRRLFEATARPHEAAESSQRHAMAYLWRARDSYRPQPYHGRVLGFLTREAPNPRGVWDALLDHVEWHDLASTHDQAMKPPAVDVLAGHVNAAREEQGV
jgi:thioesterase domain-containing protein